MNQRFSLVKWFTLSVGLALAANASVYGDTLSCASGKQLMCLGVGEKVVKNNSVCFEPLACDQKGFVCKSKLDGLADEHDSLVATHNELVAKYNEVISTHESVVSEYQALARCVKAAPTLADAKACN